VPAGVERDEYSLADEVELGVVGRAARREVDGLRGCLARRTSLLVDGPALSILVSG
jgi:hypothetical protein